MLLRQALPYTSAAVVVALIYAGWTMYARYSETRRADQEEAARKLELDRATLNMIGPDLKILTFYAPPAIHAGQKALICYGVANAKAVRIDPPIESITPSLSRCIDARPAKTTDYTLTAEDGAGHSVSQTIQVKVQ